MRILLDQAVYEMRNKGNIALLQVAVQRLNHLWPDASLEVIADAPHLLKIYCPETYPVSMDGRYNWSEGSDSLDRVHNLVPNGMLRSLFEVREDVWHRWPELTPGQLRNRANSILRRESVEQESYQEQEVFLQSNGDDNAQECPDLEQAIHGADLVVATGGGYMCDSDGERAIDVINRLERAIRLGKSTAMVGQGIGPIEDPELRARCTAVLPLVDAILVREENIAPPLLESLGVPADKIIMTGDDAVELAYQARSSNIGNSIGVSVRIAHYTEVETQNLREIRDVLHEKATKYEAPLIPVPISCDGHEADQKRINDLIAGHPQAATNWRRFEPPVEVIEDVGCCRVVVAGAFHGAVFALAQGIPVVGLVKSKEYANKFQGLVDQFGSYCQLLHLDDENLAQKLSSAIDSAWHSAEEARPHLLSVASELIELNRAGYQQIYEIVESSGKTVRVST